MASMWGVEVKNVGPLCSSMSGHQDMEFRYMSGACTLTTNTWEHEILLNEVTRPRGLISQYKYIIYVYNKVQYKFNNNNNIWQNNVMYVQLNNACCR